MKKGDDGKRSLVNYAARVTGVMVVFLIILGIWAFFCLLGTPEWVVFRIGGSAFQFRDFALGGLLAICALATIALIVIYFKIQKYSDAEGGNQQDHKTSEARNNDH